MKKSGDASLSAISEWHEYVEPGKKTPAFCNNNTRHDRLLNQFLSMTADGVYAIDHKHRIISWNRACENIFGVISQHAIGKPCYEVISGRDCFGNPVCFAHCMVFAAARQRKLVKNFEIQIVRKDEPVRVNVSTVFIQNSQVAPSIVVHLVREAPDSQRLEDNIRQMLLRLEKLTTTDKASSASKATLPLSQRERDVIFCLSHGKHAKHIAKELCISLSTVRSHIKNILCKFDVHSQMEAVAYAYKNGLL